MRPPAPGQIDGGNQSLLIADLTQHSEFANPQHADPCDELQYRVRLYNPGPGNLANVRIAADINTITRYTEIVPTIVAYTPNGILGETAFQAKIILPIAQTEEYVPYSTEVLNSAGHVAMASATKDLADGITASGYGIPIRTVDVGVTEYVEFRTRLSCYK